MRCVLLGLFFCMWICIVGLSYVIDVQFEVVIVIAVHYYLLPTKGQVSHVISCICSLKVANLGICPFNQDSVVEQRMRSFCFYCKRMRCLV